MGSKIPVFVLNGFLGSGKTTVLLKMIEQSRKKNKRVAVILNELGTVNVETHLFQNHEVIELLDGCICCTIQDDLRKTLEGLLIQHQKEKIDILLIEGTGVAHPLEILEVFSHETLENVFQVESVIGVVDASYFLDYLSIFSSSKEIRSLLKEQVRHSSIILLNKVDRIDDKMLHRIHKKMMSMKRTETPIVQTKYGDIEPKELWKRREDLSLRQTKKNSHEINTRSHSHPDTKHGPIKTVKLEPVPEVDKEVLLQWLHHLPKEVIRAKGFIRFTGESHPTHVQYANKRVRFTTVEQSNNDRSVFIFIGKDLNKEMFETLQKGFS
ncbi:MAG TPA: GTP-binding protein [Chondromyces sp.]|nr:GTP-binding protein [Chondromyces sp.]